ncbi:MAG: pyruvate:ferredoxin (flavodoxin) oxidoreductase [Chloroflexi bacterium]|nr:pyruvate:ferredoxin (flavodoxin) oxidoreductase [Chloroflexota bacterium]
MSGRRMVTIDGNEAAASVAYRANEVIAIYPITPSSTMGEWADQWAAEGRPNIWGTVPVVQQMQSEGGAAGAIHGALQTGALATTFTASQGLLLMIPNMFKIAGELTSTVFHIAARSLAAQGLSIFGDHGDVMAARSTGWAQVFANSPQEVMDFALISQASTLAARVPFLHVFDGFRTSHEIANLEMLTDDDIRAMLDEASIQAHRNRSLSPDRPFIRGTAQNPDTYFQARETVNPYYQATPGIVQQMMDRFATLTGRQYHLFDYAGAPDAERVLVLMGSGCEAAEETVEALLARGEKVGLVKVRLYRPFDGPALLAALPATVRAIAVLDRTKEPGAAGEPLYQDVVTAVSEAFGEGRAPFASYPKIVGGRYGLSSKEFTPGMVKGVLDELRAATPKNHFTIGIEDDVTHTSLRYDPDLDVEGKDVVRAMFWGLGSDGTVGANKNSIKIIGEQTNNYAQGYFVYDSKKSGSRTTSHLRFGPRPIKSTYLIRTANFVAVHQFNFLDRIDVLREADEGATLLLNSPYGPQEIWDHLPRPVQEVILARRLRLFTINGNEVARQAGMANRVNTVMQTCFFAISGVLPREEAIVQIKKAIAKTYGKRGQAVVRKNYAAVDAALEHLYEVAVPATVTSDRERVPPVPAGAPDFVRLVTAPMIAGDGDLLPVSALPADGTYPSGTTRYEKRRIALEAPVWEPDLCIQCGKCVMVCPHAVIRSKVYEPACLSGAPLAFKATDARWRELPGQQYTLQVAVEDCTGCTLCVEVCPARDKSNVSRKAINMAPIEPIESAERENWEFFLSLPDHPRADGLAWSNVKNLQLLPPLFEFSGACAGCGETPYLTLLSRLFGDRAMIANATGCSSIYGGNLPTTPWTSNKDGRGPSWSNSLFEDNAEFGLGFRLTLDKHIQYATELLERLKEQIGPELAQALVETDQSDEAGLELQRRQVATLKERLRGLDAPAARDLLTLADKLVKKSVWIVGGDGWAYDIGFGGLDHVLASGRNVNVLVMDTEVYSNTGGQSSKATPLAAVAKFAAGGKRAPKKDLGRMAMAYGNVYVAQIAMGASDSQTLQAFLEAESYDGPSLVVAYAHCIAHGIDMAKGMHQQKLAVDAGHWQLYRYDPRLAAKGQNPLRLDAKEPKVALEDYLYNENRYRMLTQSDPDTARHLLEEAQAQVKARRKIYLQMAGQAPGSS